MVFVMSAEKINEIRGCWRNEEKKERRCLENRSPRRNGVPQGIQIGTMIAN